MAGTSRVQAAGKNNSAEVLDMFSNSVQALAARVAPSVVQIQVTRYGARERNTGGRTGVVVGRQQSVGSGVIVDPDGYIVTNAHVIADAQRIKVNMVTQRDQSISNQSCHGFFHMLHLQGPGYT